MRIQAMFLIPTLAMTLLSSTLLAGCYPDPVITERPGAVDGDGDGFTTLDDCDDADGAINPGADEICDGIDNDCDALVDELGATDGTVWYVDGDNDGYGDPGVTRKACVKPDFYVDNADDCDDAQGTVFPGSEERCDLLDNDCNGEIDDGALDAKTYYWDFDADGFGDPDRVERACKQESWLVEDNTDCNDAVNEINPSAVEVCDGVDNDCDTFIDDEDETVDPRTYNVWYVDGDGDGFGNPDEDLMTMSCDASDGFVGNPDDCDDSNSEVTTECGGEDK